MNPHILQADAGTSTYVAWAKREAEKLDVLRRNMGLRTMSRVLTPVAGVKVYIRLDGDVARILVTGGVAGRTRRLNTDDGEGAAFRFYHVAGGHLDGYGEASRTGGQPNAQEVMSFDGSTLAWTATGSNDVKVMRKQKLPATYTRSTLNGQRADQLDWLTHGTRLTLAAGSDPYRVWDALKFNFGMNKTGKLLYALDVEPTIGTRQATALAVSSDATSTSLAQTWQSGVPQFVTDFYASRSPQHVLHSESSGTLQIPDVLMFNPDASGYVLVPHWMQIPASQINQSLQLFVMWDPFAELPVIFVSMPYATFVDNVPLARYDVSTSERIELRRLNPTTLGWDLLDSVDRGPTLAFAYSSAAFMYNYLGFQALTTGAAGPDYGAKLLPAIGLDLQPSLLSRQATSIALRGQTFSKPSGYDNVLNAARDGVLVNNVTTGHDVWSGATWSLDVVHASFPAILSPHGDLAWVGAGNGSAFDYYEQGALKQHFDAVPTANSSSFALYGTPSPNGLWFVKDIIGWRYDKPKTAKAVVYTKVNAPATLHLFGGTLNIPGLGSSPVNQASGSGFNQDGTLYFDTAGNVLTPAQWDALAGTTGTTFVLDGTQYDLSVGSYSWSTATVDLKYDSAVKVAKIYATKAVNLPVRGSLGGTGTIATSDAEIVQDYLLFRKV